MIGFHPTLRLRVPPSAASAHENGIEFAPQGLIGAHALLVRGDGGDDGGAQCQAVFGGEGTIDESGERADLPETELGPAGDHLVVEGFQRADGDAGETARGEVLDDDVTVVRSVEFAIAENEVVAGGVDVDVLLVQPDADERFERANTDETVGLVATLIEGLLDRERDGLEILDDENFHDVPFQIGLADRH